MSAKKVIFIANTLYWRLRSLNRIKGGPFYLGRPSRLSITGGEVFLGRGVHIDKGARIVVRNAHMKVGADSFIGKNSTLIAYADLVVGEGVLLGQNVSIHTEDHGPAGQRDRFSSSPISIDDQAWLCAGVVVTRGTRIGRAATVGANAVVTRDVPPASLSVGIPAHKVRDL